MRAIFGLAAMLFAASCASAVAPSGASPDAPPASFVQDTRYYQDDGDEVGIGAPFRRTWLSEANREYYPHLFELRTEPDAAAAVMSHIAPAEVVNVARIIDIRAPRRGILREAGAGLAAGDVVYWRFEDQHGAPVRLWRRGQTVRVDAAFAETISWNTWSWPDDTWALIERQDGSRGWVRDARSAFCLMDEACASHM